MKPSPSLTSSPGVDDWLAIVPGERILVRTGKVDIGQRISTAIALIAADELDVDVKRIDVEPARSDRTPNEGYTSGSNSIQHSGMAVRQAAATARRHLLERAARELGVDAERLDINDGLVRARDGNTSISYWELMEDKRFEIPVDVELASKTPSGYRYVGRTLDAHELADSHAVDLTTGKTRFVHDLQFDDMLHARVIRPPHYHACLHSLDESALEQMPGVQCVRDGSFVAVAAEDEFLAVRAAARVGQCAAWHVERQLDAGNVYERLRSNRRTSLPVVHGTPVDEPVPPPADPGPDASTTLNALYERPYQMHASLAPSAALALFEKDRLKVWTHTQGIYPVRASIAQTLGLEDEQVELIHSPGAGCYGHNGADDAALDAALVARALPGRPVLLKWSREDEHAWEPYASCMAVEVGVSLDRGGRVLSWSHESFSDTHLARPRSGPGKAGPSRLLAAGHLRSPAPAPVATPSMGHHVGIHRNAEPLYAFAGQRIVKHLVHDLPLRTSAMRTLGGFANVLAIECFVDELAHAGGRDPVAFRLEYLEDPRAIEVIQAAAEHIGWRPTTRNNNQGHGIAFARYKNTAAYAAVAIELEVDDAASVRLQRAVIAADAGQVIDRNGLRSQLEGGLLQAASWTLYEEVGYDANGITTRDWDTYRVLCFDNIPDIETVLVDRPEQPPLGAGEASSGPAGAAIANAVFDAVGLRLRRLPLRPDALRAAALNA